MDVRCKDCKFFDRHTVGAGGECRRYPPVKGDPREMAIFPDVDGLADWCGEHSSLALTTASLIPRLLG